MEGTFSLFLGKYKSRQATVMLTRSSLPTETQTPVTGISKWLPSQNSRVQNAKCHLMLQRADAEKTQYSLVGKVGQGIYPQGSDKTHRPDDDRMRGLGTWRHTEGVPHACTAREGIVHA